MWREDNVEENSLKAYDTRNQALTGLGKLVKELLPYDLQPLKPLYKKTDARKSFKSKFQQVDQNCHR